MLLVSSADAVGDHASDHASGHASDADQRAARRLRDAGAEVVLLSAAASTEAIVAAANQEAVDCVCCEAARLAEVTAALREAGLHVVVTTTER